MCKKTRRRSDSSWNRIWKTQRKTTSWHPQKSGETWVPTQADTGWTIQTDSDTDLAERSQSLQTGLFRNAGQQVRQTPIEPFRKNPGRNQVIPLERYWQKSSGKHFRQTPIELTRKILARKHASSVQIDISRFLLTDIGRKKQVRTSSDRHWSNPSDRHRQER